MPRVIKKYANRRLYDTTGSKHITVDGIRDLILSGEDVRVVDDTSDDDITRTVLLQIISDKEKAGRPMLSDRVLTQLIRFYGHPMQEMMAGYLENSFNILSGQSEAMKKQFEETVSGAMPKVDPFANPLASAMKNPLSNAFGANAFGSAMGNPLEDMQEVARKNVEAWTEMQKNLMAGMNPTGDKPKKPSDE